MLRKFFSNNDAYTQLTSKLTAMKDSIRKHKITYAAMAWLVLAWLAIKYQKNEPVLEYTVKAHETISTILRIHNIPPNAKNIEHFKDINDLNSDIIKVWQIVYLPLDDTSWGANESKKNTNTNPENLPVDGFNYNSRYQGIESKNTLLDDYYFVIDPWHGGIDPWSHGIVNGHAFWEANAAWDLWLRLIKGLKENGAAEITPTRINTMQWIDNSTLPSTKSLPWAKNTSTRYNDELRDFDIDWINYDDNLNQNDRKGDNERKQATRLAKRNRISDIQYKEAHKKWKKLVYIALHLDVGESLWILSQPGDSRSAQFAKELVENWFVWTHNGKITKKPTLKSKDLMVLRGSDKDLGVLIEFCDITKAESRKMRSAENRQEMIDNLVKGIVETLSKNK